MRWMRCLQRTDYIANLPRFAEFTTSSVKRYAFASFPSRGSLTVIFVFIN